MRLLFIISFFALTAQVDAQHIDSILQKLNEPIQEGIDKTIAEMFGEQDTIFTETDSFILFTTPEMIVDELDTVEFRYDKTANSYREWNYNGDELAEAMAVVYLADKRTGEPIDLEASQFFVITTMTDEETFEISYQEPVISCRICGMAGEQPDISILTKENKIEFIEVREKDDYILNDEYKITFEDGALVVEEHIAAFYHKPTENLYSTSVNRETMMEVQSYEPNGGEEEKFRIAILPVEKTKDITLDGTLDEDAWNKDYKINWRPVHSTIFGEKHTMNDLFGKYSAAWNKKALYIGLKIKDDKLVPVQFQKDQILGDYIRLDFNFEQSRVTEGKLKGGSSPYSISIGLGFDKLGNPLIVNLKSGESIDNIKAVFFRNKGTGGYDAEIGIPLSSIKELLGEYAKGIGFKKGNSINFTISLGDADDLETGVIKHIDASSRMEENIPFKMGKLEFFNKYGMRTFEEMKK